MEDFKRRLEQLAKAEPDRLAVQFKEHRLTYSNLLGSLRRLEAKLGAITGMRLLAVLPDGFVPYLLMVYCFNAKSTIIPLSIHSVTSHIENICLKIRPHLVITTEILYKKHQGVLERYPCVITKTQGSIAQEEIVVDFAWNSAVPPLPMKSTREPEQIQLMLFTSGTTGTPKGVCLSQSNITAAASMMVDFLSLGPNRRSLVTVPLYDYYGLIQIFGHVLAGASFIFGENIALPGGLIRRIADDQVTDLVLVPYTLRRLLQIMGQEGRHVMQNLEVITSSSDVLSDDILGRMFELNPKLKIFNIYGLTEAGRACYREITATALPSTSIGRPSKGVEVHIDGTKDEPGEIVLRGPNVMKGYFQEVQSDRIVFLPCAEVRTSDLGYFDEKGEIILVGRRDHIMNLMGVKIHPSEIESIALRIPGVQEAFAYIFVNGQGEPSVSLDVVLSDGQVDTNTISSQMRSALPRMFVPATINVVRQIIRTELGGKILRRREQS